MTGFVKAIVHTRAGDEIKLEYNTWGDVGIYGDEDFNPSQKFLDSLCSGEELITAMQEWFIDALDDTDYAKQCMEDIGATDRIRVLKREDMKSLELSSLLDCDYAGYGSEITYDFDSKKKKRKKTGYSI